ncbi:two-component system response regulator YesN [Paenibacillus endophyticus]|uniref:Two-component system response regulator YesN n=1 Tax=Paenibacillus endophyticus TaxID=1294268 RepID=A0A7W5CA45_9BACL|nr:response regulator [Paenibacillus endophyticus]MBB3153913.1 two-component system response regulator YesN [Paenibacillus endophyticus]
MAVKPLKVLIVDDELPLRQELRLFPWEDCGAVLIGEAGNGEEALHMCGISVPDVVVTDITMPIMDGLTLIRELRRRYPAIQIILLTCHSDFHYVQEALRLGALEYLLKVSMEEEEMKQALNKVSEAIAKERRSINNEKSERRLLQAAAFGKLLRGHDLDADDWLPTKLDGTGTYILARLILVAPNDSYIPARQQIQQTLLDKEQSDPHWLTWVTTGDKEYFVLMKALHAEEEAIASLSGVVQALECCLKAKKEQPNQIMLVHAIVSEPFMKGEELANALTSTTEWKESLFYDSSFGSSIWKGRPLPMREMTDQLAKELNEKLRMASSSTEFLKNCIQGELQKWCSAMRVRPQQLKQRLLHWQMDWLKVHDGSELDCMVITQLMGAQTLQEMIACLIQNMNEIDNGSSRIEIRSAIQWIQANMKQPISLPILAEQVGLSAHYVSRLFREETGDTVNQYITRLRMEKAVELLKQTNKKVYEIAEEVGIPSYRYFTVTFRNWTGVSPTDYKRKK